MLSNTVYDFRMALAGNSGAVLLAKVRPHSNANAPWLELVHSATNQLTLKDQSKSASFLGACKSFDLSLTNTEEETIILSNIPHNIGTSDFGSWFDTKGNFEKS
jgi:hypothetical protein